MTIFRQTPGQDYDDTISMIQLNSTPGKLDRGVPTEPK
jgi:hypothetical protein